MRLVPTMLAAVLATTLAAAQAATPANTTISPASVKSAEALRDKAMNDDTGYKIVESLTTEVGARMAGSEADARAVAWAVAKFKALGYDKVWTEPVTFPKWERKSEHGEVLGAHAQKLALTALGGSPGGTVEGEIVRFGDLESLQKAAPGSLKGKIAFIDVPMERAKDGSGYGMGSRIRGAGPSAAIKAGASGYLMRSAGTDMHRNPHTGITRFEDGLTPIPSAALAGPDADQLSRLVALGKPVSVKLALDCGWTGTYTSANVIGEMRGRSKPDEVVVIGGHLDSWDLGTGAIDDGAGVAIAMGAGKLIGDMKQRPARTIRVVAFANEEQGLFGGRAYAEKHGPDVRKHQIGAESDYGPGRIYAFSTGAPERALRAVKQIADVLAPIGIAYPPGEGGPGPDVSPFAANGLAWGALRQDGTDYFDYHHTPDDTLDKIDPKALAQNVAAYAVFAYMAADANGDFGSEAKKVTPPRE